MVGFIDLKYSVASILFKRLIIIFPLLGIAFNKCPFGDPNTGIFIYNHRSDSIVLYYSVILRYKTSDWDGLNTPERTVTISSGQMDGIGGIPNVKPISKYLAYLIIKDTASSEILNLSGNSLDDRFKIVEETEYYIEYRLDVY